MHHLLALNKIKKRKEQIFQVNLDTPRTQQACKDLAIPYEDVQQKQWEDFQDQSQLPEVCQMRYIHWLKRYKRLRDEVLKYKKQTFLKKEVKKEEELKAVVQSEILARTCSFLSKSTSQDNQLVKNSKSQNQSHLNSQENLPQIIPKLILNDDEIILTYPQDKQNQDNSKDITKEILKKRDFSQELQQTQKHQQRTQTQQSVILRNQQHLKSLKAQFFSQQNKPKSAYQIKRLEIPIINQTVAKMKEELKAIKEKYFPTLKQKHKKHRKSSLYHLRSFESLGSGINHLQMSTNQYDDYLQKVKSMEFNYEDYVDNYLQKYNQTLSKIDYNRENQIQSKLQFARNDLQRVSQKQKNQLISSKITENQNLSKMQLFIDRQQVAKDKKQQLLLSPKRSIDKSVFKMSKFDQMESVSLKFNKTQKKTERGKNFLSQQSLIQEEKKKLRTENFKKNLSFQSKIKVSYQIRNLKRNG